MKPMMRHTTKPRAVGPIIAYDLETTPIRAGTPELRYFTAYDGKEMTSVPIRDSLDLSNMVRKLTAQYTGGRFIAWNGNRFDGRFIADALIEHAPGVKVYPYLTRSRGLRGFHIASDDTGKTFFYDGIAMTGMLGTSLAAFLDLYAPNLQKMKLNFERESFDATNRAHVEYAERDSIGLWHGMNAVEGIIKKLTGMPLTPTIGNLGIKYFMANMPEEKTVFSLTDNQREVVHGSLLRGGYCWCGRQYIGPVDKYDLNQAYAAAMRETALPCGPSTYVKEHYPGFCAIYLVTLSHTRFQPVPFYIREYPSGTPRFTHGRECTGYITSDEWELLADHGWHLHLHHGYRWEDSFTMGEMVNALEQRRMSCDGGPNGPEGKMIKAIGNNAYGKTLERLDGVEFLLSAMQPDNYLPYHAEDETMAYVWYREGKPYFKPYHQPQLGAFITASVRNKVLRAAWTQPERFIYADTDCLIVPAGTPIDLPIHASQYGRWKVEALGAMFMIIGKKVYMNVDTSEIHAKGLYTRALSVADMWRWWQGTPPTQRQTQLQRFWQLSGDAPMFKERERRGTNPQTLASIVLTEDRHFRAVR